MSYCHFMICNMSYFTDWKIQLYSESCSSFMKFPVLKNLESITQMTGKFLCKLADEADKTFVEEPCNAKM